MAQRMKNLGYFAIGIVGMLGDIALMSTPTIMWERARREVAQIADINKNGITDTSEWESVYRELGSKNLVPYDRWEEGRNLSMPLLEEYISSHSNK